MKQKTYNVITSLIFLVVGVVHLIRVLSGWEVTFNGTTLPLWVSWIGVVVAGILSYSAFNLSKS
jgi:hypothetical protein